MAQYDVYPSRSPNIYLLDVQSDLIDGLATRLVIPVIPTSNGPQKIKRLHPTVMIAGEEYLVATQLLAAVPKAELKNSIMNLIGRHDDISNAIFMAFHGF